MAGFDSTVAAGGGMVMVSRDGFGDPRRVLLPVGLLTGACVAVARGGDWQWLPEPAVAVYAPAWLYPFDWRSGEHSPRHGNMLLVVEEEGTDAEVFARVATEARKRVHTREWVERKRAKLARPRARARGEES